METSVEDRPEPRATLWRYHHKQALRDALLRVLAQHEHWLAQAVVAAEAYGQDALGELLWLGDQYALPNAVWLFTDVEATHRAAAAGAVLGPCAQGLWGAELLGNFDPAWGALVVNPGSPPDESLVLQGDALDEASRWGRAVLLEALLTPPVDPGDDVVLGAILEFDGFVILRHVPTDEPITVQRSHGGARLVAFTAPDGADAFVRVMEGDRGEYEPSLVTGATLCRLASGCPGGVLLNVYGPGPERTVPPELVLRAIG